MPTQVAAPIESKKETPKKEFTIPNLSLQSNEIDEDATEEEGRKNLMDILDQQLGNVDLSALTSTLKRVEETKKPKETKKASPEPKLEANLQKNRLLEERLNLFLRKIQKRALDYQSRV